MKERESINDLRALICEAMSVGNADEDAVSGMLARKSSQSISFRVVPAERAAREPEPMNTPPSVSLPPRFMDPGSCSLRSLGRGDGRIEVFRARAPA